jgi:hypothetical protein
MPNTLDVTPNDSRDLVDAAMTRSVALIDVVRLLHHRQDLMLAVSIIAGINVPMAFAPDNLMAYLTATMAGVALWAATLLITKTAEKANPTRIGWRAVPTYAGLITFTIRLAVEDQPYALWVVGTLEVLYVLRTLYRATARLVRSAASADTDVAPGPASLNGAARTKFGGHRMQPR